MSQRSRIISNKVENPKTILVTGGAGYIGSYVNKLLNKRGYKTVVLDNLSRGSLGNVVCGKLIVGDMGDSELLDEIFSQYNIFAVMHFAAYTDVGESVTSPNKYYDNNVIKSLHLLDSVVKNHIHYFVFSSTSAIFGLADQLYVDECYPKDPINPYGRTKLILEQILSDYDRAYNLKFCALRYFNAAGADPECEVKIAFQKMTNLIPLIFNNLKKKQVTTIFGDDYPTDDGTCVRDYIHIHDLATAHILALEHLFKEGAISSAYNLGNGGGFSVREVIDAIEAVTQQKVPYTIGPRRAGDPPILVADSKKARKELGWEPIYSNLEEIISDVWAANQLEKN